MRKVILYIAASLDGFIAKSDGNVDWLHDPNYSLEGEDYGYSHLIQSIDTTFMGYSTFEQILKFDGPFPYSDKTNYVFTRSTREPHEFARFIINDAVGFTRDFLGTPGKDVWLIGGGMMNSLFLTNGLIDTIILTLIPITLGEGIPLFSNHNMETKFTLTQNVSYESGLCQLTYDVKR